MRLKRYCTTCLLLITATQCFAQQTPKATMPGFMGKRFGLFVHFNPVTLRGTEIGWSPNNEVAQADYDSLYKEFNPILFNADALGKGSQRCRDEIPGDNRQWNRTSCDAAQPYSSLSKRIKSIIKSGCS